jgi:hypothetical protein
VAIVALGDALFDRMAACAAVFHLFHHILDKCVLVASVTICAAGVSFNSQKS